MKKYKILGDIKHDTREFTVHELIFDNIYLKHNFIIKLRPRWRLLEDVFVTLQIQTKEELRHEKI